MQQDDAPNIPVIRRTFQQLTDAFLSKVAPAAGEQHARRLKAFNEQVQDCLAQTHVAFEKQLQQELPDGLPSNSMLAHHQRVFRPLLVKALQQASARLQARSSQGGEDFLVATSSVLNYLELSVLLFLVEPGAWQSLPLGVQLLVDYADPLTALQLMPPHPLKATMVMLMTRTLKNVVAEQDTVDKELTAAEKQLKALRASAATPTAAARSRSAGSSQADRSGAGNGPVLQALLRVRNAQQAKDKVRSLPSHRQLAKLVALVGPLWVEAAALYGVANISSRVPVSPSCQR